MLDIIVKNNKSYVNIADLKPWSQNPRIISNAGYIRLKKKIFNLNGGQPFKPLIIVEDGTVIGGNQRLRAMLELGYKEVWVEVVVANTDKDKLEIALADNDNDGYTDKKKLLEHIENIPDLKLEDFAVHLEEPESLDDFMGQFKTDELPESKGENETIESKEKKLIKCPECGFEFNIDKK